MGKVIVVRLETRPWRILLDIDGVMVDCLSSMSRALNLPLDLEKIQGEYDPAKIFGVPTDLFSIFGPDFWEAADWMPDGLAILKAACDAVGRDQVWFCSSPTHESSSPMGKLRWIEKHLDIHWSRRYVFTPDKFLLANGRTILIDDCDEQIAAFRAAGGPAILVARPWNSAHAHASKTFVNLLSNLDQILTGNTPMETTEKEIAGQHLFPLEVALMIGPVRIPVEVCAFTIEEFPGPSGMRLALNDGIPVTKKIEIILSGPERQAVALAIAALPKG